MKQGSNNYEKMKNKINELHKYISNSRKDNAHKLSRQLVNENQVIITETLNIKGMIKNKKLSNSIADAGWYQLLTLIKYKLEWEGKHFIQIDRFYASSKLCSACSSKNIMLTLRDREWVCSNCQTVHDRDINASNNIRKEGLRMLGMAI